MFNVLDNLDGTYVVVEVLQLCVFTGFKVLLHKFIRIVFGKFPDLLLFRISTKPISSFSPDAESD